MSKYYELNGVKYYCYRKYYAEKNKEKIKIYNRNYYLKNKEYKIKLYNSKKKNYIINCRKGREQRNPQPKNFDVKTPQIIYARKINDHIVYSNYKL